MKRDAEVLYGFANPNGTGEDNWSEQTVGRIRNDGGWDRRYRPAIDPCGSCGQVHGRIRYQAEHNPEGSQLVEIIAGTLVFLLLIAALFWALPVLFAVAS